MATMTIKKIMCWLYGIPMVPCPFDAGSNGREQMEPQEVETVETVEAVKWGADRVVNATVRREVDGYEFEMQDASATKLRPVPIDDIDKQVVREWNASKPATQQISLNNYKLIKPYVLAGDRTYKEIGIVLGLSESLVQRYGPRIKEAVKKRNKKVPI
jgi:DNA-directed RNA polymerase specialized sigma subunit